MYWLADHRNTSLGDLMKGQRRSHLGSRRSLRPNELIVTDFIIATNNKEKDIAYDGAIAIDYTWEALERSVRVASHIG